MGRYDMRTLADVLAARIEIDSKCSTGDCDKPTVMALLVEPGAWITYCDAHKPKVKK